jgi:hypothetical protein
MLKTEYAIETTGVANLTVPVALVLSLYLLFQRHHRRDHV